MKNNYFDGKPKNHWHIGVFLKTIPLLLFLLMPFFAISQTVTIGTGTSTQRYPLGNFYGYERSSSIYLSNEINQQGLITDLAWYANTAGLGSRPIKIYLKEVSETEHTSSLSTWANEISDATLVYEGSITPVSGWNNFNLNTVFIYNGGNLKVLVEANYGGGGNGGGSSGNNVRYSTATNRHAYWQADTNPPIIDGTRTNNRPNIQIAITPNIACSGTPEGGTASLNPTSGNAGSTFMASVSGQELGTGLSYQWQKSESVNGPWSDIAGATSLSNEITAENAPLGTKTYYRLKITCDNSGLSDYSSVVDFTIVLEYCEPTSSSGDYLSSIQIESSIDAISYSASSQPNNPVKGYDDLSASMSMDVIPGEEIDVKTLYVGGSNTVKVWVDWNNDGEFSETELMGQNYVGSAANELSFYVPNHVPQGTYRIRVRGRFSTTPFGPCDVITFGSAVDFSLNVVPPPSCLRPTDLSASNIEANSASLSWTEHNSATVWEIEYGSSGFSQGTGTIINPVNSNPYLLTGLSANTVYEYYVRSVCSTSDSSAWAGPYEFKTTCDVISALPYMEDFEGYGTGSDAFPDCWERPVTYTSGSVWPSIVTYSGSNRLRFQSLPADPTYAISPPFAEDINNLRVSFDLTREGANSGTIDVGVMSDAFDTSTFELVATINPDNNNNIEYVFDLNNTTLSGSGNFIAFRHNSVLFNWYYWLDNFKVDLSPSCIDPTDLSASNITFTSADISWTAGAGETAWNISWGAPNYTPGDTNEVGSDSSITTNYHIAGLTESTNYDVYVQSDCGGDLSVWTGPYSFRTGTPGQIGEGSGTSQYLPIYSFYGYSYTQAIYQASEMMSAGISSGEMISKIRYKMAGNPGSNSNGWTVFLGNSVKGSFSSTTDWVTSGMTEVYSGTVTFAPVGQWMEIELDTPFLYTGDNLIVAVKEGASGYGSSGSHWAGYTSPSSNSGIYYYSDSTNPNPSSPPTADGRTTTLPQIQFEHYTAASCSGTPEAGTATLSVLEGGPNSNYTVSASGYEVAGDLEFQWQFRINGGDYVDQGSPTTVYEPFEATAPGNVGDTVEWRLKVTCTNSNESAYSDTAVFTVIDTCEWTVHVWSNGWGDATTWSLRDENNAVVLSGGTYNSGFDDTKSIEHPGPLTFQISNWGTFEDNEAEFTVSNDNGIIVMGQMGAQAQIFSNLECSDEALVECSGTPDGGIFTMSPHSGNGREIDLLVTDYTNDLGITTAWETRINGGDWYIQSITDAVVTVNLSPYVQHGDVWEFRYAVTCTNSNETGYSNIEIYTVDLSNCTPTYTYTGDRLSSVSTSGADSDISYTSSTGGAHYDRTGDLIIETAPGESFTLNTSYVGGRQTIGIWVDWNEDTVFAGSAERYAISNSSSANQSFTIEIPSNIAQGDYVMRVRGAYDFNNEIPGQGDAFACNHQNYGSSIDVTVRVTSASCPNPTDLTLDSVSLTTASVSWTPGGEETSWDISWGPVGYEPGDINELGNAISSVTSHYIAGLVGGESYDIYVRADCGDSDISLWSGPLRFTTGENGACEIKFDYDLEDGIGNLATLLFADDFEIYSSEMEMDKATFWIFSNENIVAASELVFYEDNNGKPGNVIESFTNLNPTSQTNVDRNVDVNYDVLQLEFDLPTTVTLSRGKYWVGIKVTPVAGDSESKYWIITDSGYGAPAHFNNGQWNQNSSGYDLAFHLEGICKTAIDFVYSNGAWMPGNPNQLATADDNIIVVDGVADENDSIYVELDINNILIHPNATLAIEGILNLHGNLTIQGDLIFLSDSFFDGELGYVSPSSVITGNATVHRFMSENRAYRMVSSPVTTGDGTIWDNWQEGANNPDTNTNIDPEPGYGTHITGSNPSLGFDVTNTGNRSLFTASVSGQNFVAVPNTNATTMEAGDAFLLFVRGDRSIDLNDPTNMASGETILRTRGKLFTGPKVITHTVNAGGDYIMFGNPYQSGLDMNAVLGASANVNTSHFYIYDPTLGVHGAYVTMESGSNSNPSSFANEYLQPGQAVQIMALDAGTVTINIHEDHKAPGEFTATHRGILSDNMLTVQLYTVENYNEGKKNHDAFRMLFDENFSNDVTSEDGLMPFNFFENIGVNNNGTYLSIERRDMPENNEVFQLYTQGYYHTNYILEVTVDGLDGTAFYLEDLFTGDMTALESGANTYSFAVDEDEPSSISEDRFVIRATRPLGIADFDISNFALYPNPVKDDMFYISTPNLNGQTVKVTISDVIGKVLHSEYLEVHQNRIAVTSDSELPSGVYMVTLEREGHMVNFKLIRE